MEESGVKEIRYRGGLVMREEYHSAFGRTAKNACIEPYSLCLATLLFIPMPSLTSTISQSKLVLILLDNAYTIRHILFNIP